MAPELLQDLGPLWQKYGSNKAQYKGDLSDPSSYISPRVAWEMILRLDQCLHHFSRRHSRLRPIAEQAAARALGFLADVGAPSWGKLEYRLVFDNWDFHFETACAQVLTQRGTKANDIQGKDVQQHAFTIILRAAYYTIMMRSAHELGPGLTEGSNVETALLHMI